MKPFSKLFLVSTLIFVIGACGPLFNSNLPAERPVKTEKDYYEERKERDEDRSEIINRERDRHSGETCEALDRRDDAKKECEDMCEDMYVSRGDKRDCEELEASLIKELFEVYEKLKDSDDLELIELNLFDTYLNVSISGLDKITRSYSSSEAEDFLLWMLTYPKFARVFQKEDDDYGMLTNVLNKLDKNYNKNTLYTSFTKKIDGDELMQVAINNGDSSIVNWFMDYINDIDPDCESDRDSKACFEIYCKIGDDLDEDVREDWLDFKKFESYIEKDIIDEKVNSRDAESTDTEKYNATGWRYGRTHIEDLDDLNSDWVDELCHGLR